MKTASTYWTISLLLSIYLNVTVLADDAGTLVLSCSYLVVF